MAEDEVFRLNEISRNVDESENQLVIEKQTCKVKQNFICMFKNKLESCKENTLETEKKYLVSKEKHLMLEKNLKSIKLNNKVMDQYKITLTHQLSKWENTLMEKSTKSKEDKMRLQNTYNEHIKMYETKLLAARRRKLQNYKKKHYAEITEMDAKCQFYERNQECYRKTKENETRQQIIRLASYFKEKQMLKKLEEKIKLKEIKYTDLLIRKERSPEVTQSDDTTIVQKPEFNLKNKLDLDMNTLEMMKHSPSYEEENTTPDNLMKEEPKIIHALKEEIKPLSVYESNENKKSTLNLGTFSFWEKPSIEKKSAMVYNKKEMYTEIEETYEDNNFHQEQKVKKNVSNHQPEKMKTDIGDGTTAENKFKKINILEDVVLKLEETNKILEKLPDKDAKINNRVLKRNDGIVQKIDLGGDHVQSLIDENPQGKYALFNNFMDMNNATSAQNIQIGNAGDTIKMETEHQNKDVTTNMEQQYEVDRETRKNIQITSTVSVQHILDEQHNPEIKNNDDMEHSKFFPRNEEPPKDENLFITPASKKIKIDITQNSEMLPKRNYVKELEMEFQAFNTQTSYYGDCTSQQSPEYDAMTDCDSKSSAMYVMSPEPVIKPQVEEKNESLIQPMASTSHNFFASLFGGGGETSKKPSTSGFSFSFGRKADAADKPPAPLFFETYKSDSSQQPPKSSSDKPHKSLFF